MHQTRKIIGRPEASANIDEKYRLVLDLLFSRRKYVNIRRIVL